MIKKSTYELIIPIVEAINKTVLIDSITDNTLFNYTIYSTCTKWTTKGFTVTIGGNSYEITAIVANESITVQGTIALDLETESFELYEPKFYHGTIKATEADLNRKENNRLWASDKLPMIWLHEAVEETHHNNESDAIARESRCELYFMIDADFSKWVNEDHYELAIKPMRNLIDEFMKAMKSSGLVDMDNIEDFRTMDFARWGTYLDKSGSEKQVFSSYSMSGSKLDITIPFIRNQTNCC